MEELEFKSRFKDMEYKEFFNFIENLFHVQVASLNGVITALCPDHAGIESELVELQGHCKVNSSGVTDFWSLVSDTEYPLLKQCMQR